MAYAYRFGGKQKLLSFGAYPAVSLKCARQLRDEAKEQLASGIDPGVHKKALKAATDLKHQNSFEVVAREWFEKNTNRWALSNSSVGCHLSLEIPKTGVSVILL